MGHDTHELKFYSGIMFHRGNTTQVMSYAALVWLSGRKHSVYGETFRIEDAVYV